MRGRWIKNWFSNFEELDEPFRYQGMTFTTVEVFYQCMKIPKEERILRWRVSLMTPAAAKRFCSARRKNFRLRSDWEDIKEKAMGRALGIKFDKGTTWYDRLKKTTGPIVEKNNWHDNIWGSCICEKCSNKGRNLLGSLLMKIREENRWIG